MTHLSVIVLRLGIVAVSLGLWFLTQKWISARLTRRKGEIYDAAHEWTAPWHRKLTRSPHAVKFLLITSSLGIDTLGVFILALSLFGNSFRPFVGLLVLFSFRQLCQAMIALPSPPGMIWRNPGIPSLLVTYGVSNDLFFSGHTAMAVYGALEVMRVGGPVFTALAVLLVAYEIAVVLVLRAHWTMDVVAGALAGLWVHSVIWVR